jgi:curved DNA-binding protein CbpA
MVQRSPEKIKAARNKLIRKHHSDVNSGDDEAAKLINASYDVLKHGYQAGFNDRPFRPQPSEERNAPWQTDERGSCRISRENYSDINYFKKRMWELSNHSRKKYTIWAFDGRFFRGCLTVFGSPEIFNQMARAMVIWNGSGNPYATRAVFVQKNRDPNLYLIYLDKKMISPPIQMEHDSFNMNPANDMIFMHRLPERLDHISANQKPDHD